MTARQPVTHEDLADRLAAGDVKFVSIEAQLAAIAVAQAAIAEEQKKTREILEAWAAGKAAGEFIIWLGKVLGGWVVIVTAVLAATKFRLWTVFGGN